MGHATLPLCPCVYCRLLWTYLPTTSWPLQALWAYRFKTEVQVSPARVRALLAASGGSVEGTLNALFHEICASRTNPTRNCQTVMASIPQGGGLG